MSTLTTEYRTQARLHDPKDQVSKTVHEIYANATAAGKASYLAKKEKEPIVNPAGYKTEKMEEKLRAGGWKDIPINPRLQRDEDHE